jgi:formate dehydrogenase subunit beta
MRAFIELVKLKQGHLDDVLLVGIDCLGAFANVDYPRFANNDGEEATLRFVKAMLTDGHPATSGVDLSLACRACEYFVPDNADLLVGLVGVDPSRELLIQANTAKGEAIFANLGLAPGEEPEGRKAALADLTARRIAQRDRMFQETSEATADLAKLNAFLANCVNCYNCRVACPVCYCKECVFLTNVFEYEPSQYLRWAKRKGLIKMPTDTVFFHLTRLMHMSTACVGCGQCSNACPNNVPVMELFRTIAHYTQRAFNYTAGRSLEDEPPLSVFREGEFPEVTGGK